MPKMIQIRHVPDALHRRLKACAAASGMALSDYLKAELERISGQFTYDEMRERLAMVESARVRDTPVKARRAERAADSLGFASEVDRRHFVVLSLVAAAPAAPATPAVTLNPQPLCSQIAGNLYLDDVILSVAHKYQVNTAWHLERPKLS